MIEDLPEADSLLGRLAGAAALFESLPRIRDEAWTAEYAGRLDTFLVLVARSRGAIDLGIGEWLDALSAGGRAMRLGYASIGDYARERLGIAASTAQKMARLARRLRESPLLREAVRSGEVSVRQAEAVLPVARGDAEQTWVKRARLETVRSLKAAVKHAGASEALEDEPFGRLRIEVAAGERPVLDEALEVAGRLLGATARRWERIEALAEEYLGTHGGAVAADEPEAPEDWMEGAKEWLERESRQWACLARPDPVAVPGPVADPHASPKEVDANLRQLARLRARWDEVFGHLAMLFRRMQGWTHLEFASFDHYAEERLGMSGRAVEQRAALERRLHSMPSLRRALADRRISYEQARLIARHADGSSVDAWVERAAGLTCVALRDELQRDEERQTCARGSFEAVVPLRVRTLLRHAFDAVRREEGRGLSPGECLVRIARHFLDVWKPALARRSTLQRRVLARDGGRCQVPGCSRAAVHAHHIEYRSAGGRDEPENLVSLCAAHHLRGIHMGRVRVCGAAPDGLRWEMGAPPDPLEADVATATPGAYACS